MFSSSLPVNVDAQPRRKRRGLTAFLADVLRIPGKMQAEECGLKQCADSSQKPNGEDRSVSNIVFTAAKYLLLGE
jgi:hypothetical protein